MFAITLNTADVDRVIENTQAAVDQVPYALALALNQAAFNTRNLLVQEWPGKVNVRNQGFIRYALRRVNATKQNLRVEIFDQSGKAFMERLDTGGTHAARGSNLAIPTSNVRIGARGVRENQKPRTLPNSFVSSKNGTTGIYQVVGKGKNKRAKLMYLLKPSVRVPKKISFHQDFVISMTNEVRTSFPAAMAKAMRTRR